MAAARQPVDCNQNGFVRLFECKWVAILAVCILLLMDLGAYALVHAFRPTAPEPLETSIAFRGGLFGVVVFDDAQIRRHTSRQEGEDLKRSVVEKLEEYRKRALAKRQTELDRARHLIGLGLSTEARNGPGVLGCPCLREARPVSEIAGAVASMLEVAAEVDRPSNEEYAATDLRAAATWLEDMKGQVDADLRGADLKSIVAALGALAQEEDEALAELKLRHRVAGSRLYFRWVHHEGAGWILEVSVWALAGMLCNTLIALIVLTYRGTYNAARFATVFPKLILAPLLAVVFTAMWSSGFTESGVTYVNLPYFLVFSFVLGYATEQLFSKMRDVVGVILGTAGLSEEKLRMADSLTPYTFVNPPESPWALVPTTVEELREKAKRVARHEVEKGIVTELAKRPAPEVRPMEVA